MIHENVEKKKQLFSCTSLCAINGLTAVLRHFTVDENYMSEHFQTWREVQLCWIKRDNSKHLDCAYSNIHFFHSVHFEEMNA